MIRRIGLASMLARAGERIPAKRRSIFGVVILAVLLVPSSAAAVATFGSNLSRPANIGHSVAGSDATEAIGTLPGTSTAPGGTTAPINGVIVRWRIKMGITTTAVALRVIRPGNSDTATGAGTGETVTPPAATTSELAARLPVQSGDGIGVNFPDGTTLTARSDTPGATDHAWFPLVDGAPPDMGSTLPSRELLINADVEPDCDKDGLGDETQDPDTSSCTTTGQRAAALKKCKKKHKKALKQKAANHTLTPEVKKQINKKFKKCKKKANLLPV